MKFRTRQTLPSQMGCLPGAIAAHAAGEIFIDPFVDGCRRSGTRQ
jgi:hypothetical protein